MFEGLIVALELLLQIKVLGFIVLGTVIGLIFGVLPGLGGIIALAILLPFSYGWDPRVAMFFFAGVLGAVPFGGSISAILLNTPGTAENAASCFDGHPMARKGEGKKALGISATASACGAIVGLILLVGLVPVLRMVVLAFGPPEFLFLCLFGLVSVAFAARGNLIKGLLSGMIGLLLSFIGYSSVFGILRFNFGSEYLWDGIKLVPFLVGFLAISEMISYSIKGGAITSPEHKGETAQESAGVLDGVKAVFNKKLCFFRSSALGTLVGMIPGVGAAVANFLSYIVTVQSSRYPERFGTGEPEGLIASEAANNACTSGAFLPTVAFGIPGSGAMAVVLGIFILHGLEPGPLFLRDHMDVLFAIIFGILISNILASGLGLLTASYLSRITTIDVSYIIPIVLMLCFAGSYSYRGNFWDVVLAMLAGIFGYVLKKAGYPVICLVIGYILGVLAEKAFHQSLMISRGSYSIFFTRPVALGLLILIVFVLVFPFIRFKRRKNGG